MRTVCLVISVLAICFCGVAHAQECEFSNDNHPRLPLGPSMLAIESQFAASAYECATRATQKLALSLLSLPNREGYDARFALREMAINISRNVAYPSEQRRELLHAAVISLAGGETGMIKEEIQADVRMLMVGGKALRSQNDTVGWLDVLTLAIRLDRQLKDSDRRIAPQETQPLLHDPYRPYNHFDRLATLAELTKGDKVLEKFRSELIRTIYFNVMNWREDPSREVALDRCKQLLRLVEALSDVTSCKHCPPDWRWWPIMKVGAAYKRLGMTEESKVYVEQAIQIVRSQTDLNSRLGGYRYVLSELIYMPYDRQVILSFLDEMEELANTLDTPIAKEVRSLWLKDFLESARFKR